MPLLFQPSPPPCTKCGTTTVLTPAFEENQRVFAGVPVRTRSIIAPSRVVSPITGPPQWPVEREVISLSSVGVRRYERGRTAFGLGPQPAGCGCTREDPGTLIGPRSPAGWAGLRGGGEGHHHPALIQHPADPV